MKKLIILSSLLFAPHLAAEEMSIPGITPEMMQQIERMERCMSKIDKNKMKAFEQQARQLESEIYALCDQGKRKQAQEKAETFGKKMENDPTIKAMTKCSEGMEKMMQDMPGLPETVQHESEMHVCDEPR